MLTIAVTPNSFGRNSDVVVTPSLIDQDLTADEDIDDTVEENPPPPHHSLRATRPPERAGTITGNWWECE